MSIKRYEESCMEGGGVALDRYGSFVEYNDHIASHAVDEDDERTMFESVCPYRIDRHNGVYESQRTQDGWNMWIFRARLREIKP